MQYYIMYQGQVTGPMTAQQLMAYGVNRNTMVSADGGDWKPLFTYPELMVLLGNTPAAPLYFSQRQVGFFEAIKLGFQKYACFTGRSSRSEYWWWQLFTSMISWLITILLPGSFNNFDPNDPSSILLSSGYIVSSLVGLILFLPNLGVAVRRLHDTGRSGWWVLLNLLCCIGSIILLVWYIQPSQDSDNEYGPVPNVE